MASEIWYGYNSEGSGLWHDCMSGAVWWFAHVKRMNEDNFMKSMQRQASRRCNWDIINERDKQGDENRKKNNFW